jgi:hypothetical protein
MSHLPIFFNFSVKINLGVDAAVIKSRFIHYFRVILFHRLSLHVHYFVNGDLAEFIPVLAMQGLKLAF